MKFTTDIFGNRLLWRFSYCGPWGGSDTWWVGLMVNYDPGSIAMLFLVWMFSVNRVGKRVG